MLTHSSCTNTPLMIFQSNLLVIIQNMTCRPSRTSPLGRMRTSLPPPTLLHSEGVILMALEWTVPILQTFPSFFHPPLDGNGVSHMECNLLHSRKHSCGSLKPMTASIRFALILVSSLRSSALRSDWPNHKRRRPELGVPLTVQTELCMSMQGSTV